MSKLSIVTTAWMSVPMIKRFMKGVEEATQNTDWEGFIVYEKDDLETAKFLEGQPIWHVLGLDPPAKGHCYAADKGFEFARKMNPESEYLALMDYDVIPSNSWFSKIEKIFDIDVNIGIVGPLSYPRYEILVQWLDNLPIELVKEELLNSKEVLDIVNKREPPIYFLPPNEDVSNRLFHKTAKEMEFWRFAWEAFFVMRRECYDDIGLYLRNPYPINEQPFNDAARKQGWKIVCANRVYYWHCDFNCDVRNPSRGPAVVKRGSW